MVKVYFGNDWIMDIDVSKTFLSKIPESAKEEFDYMIQSAIGHVRDSCSDYDERDLTEEEINEIWGDNLHLRKMGLEVLDSIEEDDLFTKTDIQFEQMEAKLAEEDFKVWKELRNKEVGKTNEVFKDWYDKDCPTTYVDAKGRKSDFLYL